MLVLTFVLPGITASGLFSRSLMTFKVKQRAIHQGETSPNLKLSSNLTSSSSCDNMRSSSPLVNDDCTEQNDEHQDKRVNIKESDNRMVIFSDDKSNSQSQVVMVTDRGALHAFTVALALSVHSIFEGLAFGLQKSIYKSSK